MTEDQRQAHCRRVVREIDDAAKAASKEKGRTPVGVQAIPDQERNLWQPPPSERVPDLAHVRGHARAVCKSQDAVTMALTAALRVPHRGDGAGARAVAT